MELVVIERGYDRRHRHLWSATRWETFYMMSAFAGGDAMKQSGLNYPTDLIQFPWERDNPSLPTEEEQEDLKNMMNNIKMPVRK